MQKKRTKSTIEKSNGTSVGSFGSLNEGFIPNDEQSQEIIDKFKAIINTRLDKLYDTKGADGELYAYGTAVNQVKKKAEQPKEAPAAKKTPAEETPTEEPMDKDQKLKEMIQAALSKPLSEKKKSTAFTSEYDDKFTDKRKNLPDGLQKAILKKQGKLDEFETGEELIADEPISEDLDLGHQDDEPHMIKGELYKIAQNAMALYNMLKPFDKSDQEVDLPAWWQSKITKACTMLGSARSYLEFELKEPQIDAMVDAVSGEEAINEKFASKAQQKYLYATNPKAAEELGSKMTKKDYKNLPEKIKEAILAKLKESKSEYAQIEKKISDLQAKGKNAGDPEMQKLIKRRAELEKSKK